MNDVMFIPLTCTNRVKVHSAPFLMPQPVMFGLGPDWDQGPSCTCQSTIHTMKSQPINSLLHHLHKTSMV